MPRKVPLPFALAAAAAAQSMWEEQEKRPCYYATRTISPHAIDDFCSYENPKQKKVFGPIFVDTRRRRVVVTGGGGGMRPQPVFVLLVSTSCCGEPELLLHFVSSPLRPPLSSLRLLYQEFVRDPFSPYIFTKRDKVKYLSLFLLCCRAKNTICHNCYVDHSFRKLCNTNTDLWA